MLNWIGIRHRPFERNFVPKEKYFRLKNSNFMHCLSACDLLLGIDLAKLRTDKSKLDKRIRHIISNHIVTIFIDAVKEVVEDVIMNGVEFYISIPAKEIGGRGSGLRDSMKIVVEPMDEEKSMLYWKDGKKTGFDPFKTNFRIYRIMILLSKGSGNVIKIPLKVDRTRRNMLMNKANSGNIKAGPVKTYDDYIDSVHRRFAWMDRRDVTLILRTGFRAMINCVCRRRDFAVQSHAFYVATKPYETMDPNGMQIYMAEMMASRIEYLYNILECMWDGWLWFSVKRDMYEELKERIESGEEVDYGRRRVCKLYDLAVCNAGIFFDNIIMRVRKEAFDKSGEGLWSKEWRYANWSVDLDRVIDLKIAGAEAYEAIDKWSPKELMFKNRKYTVPICGTPQKKFMIKKNNGKRRAELDLEHGAVPNTWRVKHDLIRLREETLERIKDNGGYKEQLD